MKKIFLFNLLLLLLQSIQVGEKRGPFPIQFSLSESKVVTEIPQKDRDFAFLIPGKFDTYIYNQEADYYKDYQRAYFAVTRKKGGWDCLRHYEIIANGCIPWFIDIDKCNPNTMAFLPKELIKEAMNLPGVSFKDLKIDHSKFDKDKYYEILRKLLEHMRRYLTATAMAKYILETVNYEGTGKILYLSKEDYPDYLRCNTLIGLIEYLGNRVIDYPKVEHIYKSYKGNIKKLYGKGFSYTKILEDREVDRTNLEERIKNKEFDLIIYGSVHRGLFFYQAVLANYPPEKIIYLCGEDEHKCPYGDLNNLFLREFDALNK